MGECGQIGGPNRSEWESAPPHDRSAVSWPPKVLGAGGAQRLSGAARFEALRWIGYTDMDSFVRGARDGTPGRSPMRSTSTGSAGSVEHEPNLCLSCFF